MAAFAVGLAAAAAAYMCAASVGRRRDRRHRRWPRRLTACWLAGLTALSVDLVSPLATAADTQLSAHMAEHMVIWVLAAPLLAAGAPMRLSLFALRPAGRRRLARALHVRPLAALAHPAGATVLFAAALAITHIPAVYGLTLQSQLAHGGEHALYVLSATLLWATLLGVDPLPGRVSARARMTWMGTGMVPMVAIGAWLALAPHPVYAHYVATLGVAALHDQRLAALWMVVGSVPALAWMWLLGPRRREVGSPRRDRSLAHLLHLPRPRRAAGGPAAEIR